MPRCFKSKIRICLIVFRETEWQASKIEDRAVRLSKQTWEFRKVGVSGITEHMIDSDGIHIVEITARTFLNRKVLR